METSEVTDDVLTAVLGTLVAEFSQPTVQKKAAARHIWFRNSLPLVCKRWHRLVLGTPAIWSTLIIDPSAEAHHLRRLCKSQEAAGTGSEPRGGSGSSTPMRESSPVLGSSPDSDSGGYWTSIYAPYQTVLPGSSPPSHYIARQRLHKSFSKHQRAQLRASAVIAWLHEHAAAAAGVTHLAIDLTHHSVHDFNRHQLELMLAALPRLQTLHMIGAVDGTDSYEPLSRIRTLQELHLFSASQGCLDGGLLALCFLPSLRHLSVSLDIQPASPWCITDLPTGLVSLNLGGMWLQQLPPVLDDLTDLTSITLERCQVDNNPLPQLLTLPQLATITIRNVGKSNSSNNSMPRLLPMTKPQQQTWQLQQAAVRRAANSSSRGSSPANAGSVAATAGGGGGGGVASPLHQGSPSRLAAGSTSSLRSSASRDLARMSTGSSNSSGLAAELPFRSGSLPLINTTITSLALVDVGLQQLPSCVSQLVSLRDLNLALNHDMGLAAGSCLPATLSQLTGLQGLCLGHCGLGQFPPVVAACSGLTRLELQGNPLTLFGTEWFTTEVGFKDSLQALDLSGQGSTRCRMRGIPAWVGSCCNLRELRLGCSCLGYGNNTLKHSDVTASMHMGPTAPAPYSPRSAGSAVLAAYAVSNSSPVGVGRSSSARSSVEWTGLGGGSGAGAGPPSAMTAASGAAVAQVVDGLSLQQLPELLPQLDLLQIEGGVWEQRAVRDALQLVRQLERTGSRLQVVLPL